jgi:hypothetical protein
MNDEHTETSAPIAWRVCVSGKLGRHQPQCSRSASVSGPQSCGGCSTYAENRP